MARTLKAQRLSSSYAFPDFKTKVPPREISDILVKQYFTSFESTYRILHRQLFYKEYEQYWSSPQDANTLFVAKILLVVAIGSLFYDEGADGMLYGDMIPQSVYSIQTWLQSPGEKSRVTVGGVEVQCLLLLVKQMHSLENDLSWINVGLIIRNAMSVGLQRDPSHFPKMTVLRAEVRRRLWSTVLELALQSSLDSGLPPLFSFHDFDCEPPSNYDDADIDENSKEYPRRKPDTFITDTSIQISLRRSLKTRLEICTLLNDFRSDPSHEEVLSLGSELTSFIRSHSDLYRASQACKRSFTTSQINLLDILCRQFLLALHLPYAIKAKSNPKFYFSRKVALENAMLILSYPEDGASAKDFTRMKLKSGGCFRETMSRASMAVGLELINQINEDSPFAFMPGPTLSYSFRKPLHEAIDTVVTWSRRRLHGPDTNVKCHMFHSMVQAQTQAMEKGEEVKKAISDAAKRSTEEAYQILRKQIPHSPIDRLTPPSSNGMTGFDNFEWDYLVCRAVIAPMNMLTEFRCRIPIWISISRIHGSSMI